MLADVITRTCTRMLRCPYWTSIPPMGAIFWPYRFPRQFGGEGQNFCSHALLTLHVTLTASVKDDKKERGQGHSLPSPTEALDTNDINQVRAQEKRKKEKKENFDKDVYTAWPNGMSQRKWIETKKKPNRSRSGNLFSCCLASLLFLCDIPFGHAVVLLDVNL